MQELLASALMILEHFGHFLFGGSFSCLVQIMTIQVIAEREQKIRSEVKEIQKVFFCSLCNKQYKLAHEFESHLSSYDHNHRKVMCLLGAANFSSTAFSFVKYGCTYIYSPFTLTY